MLTKPTIPIDRIQPLSNKVSQSLPEDDDMQTEFWPLTPFSTDVSAGAVLVLQDETS